LLISESSSLVFFPKIDVSDDESSSVVSLSSLAISLILDILFSNSLISVSLMP